MPFYSVEFLLLFLPASFLSWRLLKIKSERLATTFLIGVSVFYYALNDPSHVTLILILCVSTYWLASLGRVRLLVALNLGVLVWFKLSAYAIPLGLSFFALQRVGLGIDLYKKRTVHLEPLGFFFASVFLPPSLRGR